MLLGFPPHELACLLFLDALGLDLLYDHITSADGGHDVLRLHVSGIESCTNCIGYDAGIHDLAFDDRIGLQLGDGNLYELRRSLSMVHYCDLDEARTDIETYCRFLTAEERHDVLGYETSVCLHAANDS